MLWTRWGRDWTSRATPASVARTAADHLNGGEIILLHDSDAYAAPASWARTADALPEILARIAEAGLACVALGSHAE